MGQSAEGTYDRRGINATYHRRRAARAIWASGGRLAEAAERSQTGLLTLRKWLQAPEFQALLAEEAMEPIVQAASAVVRWAPAAVARLIRDLDSESANDARRAAREILRLAMDVQKHLIQSQNASQQPESKTANDQPPTFNAAMDPLSQQLEELSDEKVEAILGILNGPPDGGGVQNREPGNRNSESG
ncbi:MAG: hypothetical protein WBD63_06020 [Phycisphaerae bacterium]|nr:hypothetical protein [Phycisphaerae bacterium]